MPSLITNFLKMTFPQCRKNVLALPPQNMLQVHRNSLPDTVSHPLAEAAWVYIYSLDLFSQGICLARNMYCSYAHAQAREIVRERWSLATEAEESTCGQRPLEVQNGTGVEIECKCPISATLWMWDSRESNNSKSKPVFLFVKEEGQNIFKSLLALYTTFKYFDIQYESFNLYSFPETHKYQNKPA